MTEEITYSNVFIGECVDGGCTRPATVRVHEDFVLCALHHARYETGADLDAAAEVLDLIKGWHSIANLHGNDYLARMFCAAEEELLDLRSKAKRRQAQLERAEHESIPNEEIRAQMGEAKRYAQNTYPTVFAKVLARLSGYLGEDMAQLADDLTSAMRYGDKEREALLARLKSNEAEGPSEAFMHALALYLDLDREAQMELALALAFES